MHELSIAISIVELAADELERHPGSRVEAVHLKLGALSGVVKEALRSAYELASEQSPLAGSRLVVLDVPVEIFCPSCAGERQVESIQELRCRVCGAFSSQIVHGRELEVVALEISDEPVAQAG